MKRIYKLVFSVILIFNCMSGLAQEISSQIIHVETIDGKFYDFIMSENLTITPMEESLVISDMDGESSFPIENLKRFTFLEYDASSLIPTHDESILFSFRNDILNIRFAIPNASVVISTLDGKLIYSSFINEDGTFSLNLTYYERGIYIITTGTKTLKLIKR